jgi:hypothetical protein
MKITKEIEKFELKHKIIFFCITIFLTILITRMLVLIQDPNPIFLGYELHHFYYGIVLLIITNLLILFGHRNQKINILLSGISIGLILDQFMFILGKIENTNYFSTTFSAIVFFLIIALATIIIKKYA